MKQLDWNQKKLDELSEHLSELELAEKKLQEAIKFVSSIGKRATKSLKEEQGTLPKNE